MSYGPNFTDVKFLKAIFASSYDYPFSIVAWIKKSEAQWEDAYYDYLLIFGDSFTSEVDQVRMHTANSHSVAVHSVTDTPDTRQAIHAFTADSYNDVWVPVIGVWTSDTSRDIYIEDSTNVGSNTDNGALTTGCHGLKIGNTMSAYGGFNGNVCEVAVFSKALSTEEVDLLQTAAETGPAPNTVASADCIGYWPLSADQGTHTDQSGNGGPDLVVNGAMDYVASHPTIGSSNTTILVPTGPVW